MNWNIFWCIYTMIFAAGTLIAWFFLFYRKRNIKTKCTSIITGKVVKYSTVQYNGINLPVVEYIVNDIAYNVVGPKFKGVVVKSFPNLFNKGCEIDNNLTTRDDLPEVLKINIKSNSITNITQSPLYDLYPIGSEVDVFYNPNNPKESYVQRYIKPIWISKLCLPVGVILVLLSLYFLLGPTIKY